jgi:GNAT superfamily N-acetyltransferase
MERPARAVVVNLATREEWTRKLQAMEPITVRETRRSDREALARIHAEVARYYVDLAPDYFQVLERFAKHLHPGAPAVDSATLQLVAEADGEVVGALVARLLPPDDAAKREITSELAATSLRIEYLAVAAARRRQGVGTRLVEAAEAWGREAGATISETTTYHGSPLSVPFWGERMSYEELSVNLRKPL